MGESNARTGWAAGRELDNPCEVLPEIHDSFSRWGSEHLLSADPFNDADAGANLGEKAAGRSVDNRHRRPRSVIETSGGPSIGFEAGVELLAVEQAGTSYATLGRLPRGVGLDECAVSGLESRDRSDVGSPIVGLSEDPDSTPPPPVGERDADRVAAFDQHC